MKRFFLFDERDWVYKCPNWNVCTLFQWNVRNIVERTIVEPLKFSVLAKKSFHLILKWWLYFFKSIILLLPSSFRWINIYHHRNQILCKTDNVLMVRCHLRDICELKNKKFLQVIFKYHYHLPSLHPLILLHLDRFLIPNCKILYK